VSLRLLMPAMCALADRDEGLARGGLDCRRWSDQAPVEGEAPTNAHPNRVAAEPASTCGRACKVRSAFPTAGGGAAPATLRGLHRCGPAAFEPRALQGTFCLQIQDDRVYEPCATSHWRSSERTSPASSTWFRSRPVPGTGTRWWWQTKTRGSASPAKPSSIQP
jgi:hypothetical protein